MISIREILKYLKKKLSTSLEKEQRKHGQKASTCSKLLTLKEKLKDARTKNKVLYLKRKYQEKMLTFFKWEVKFNCLWIV